jgi:hypothetical protein
MQMNRPRSHSPRRMGRSIGVMRLGLLLVLVPGLGRVQGGLLV